MIIISDALTKIGQDAEMGMLYVVYIIYRLLHV